MSDFLIETARLGLRSFVPDDLHAMLQVLGDPEVMHFGSGAKDTNQVQQWLHRRAELEGERGFGLWAVVSKSTGAVIGYCGLTWFPDINGQPEIEIGYRLARASWGQGYATEAATAVRNYAFTVLGLTRLIALIDPENERSLRVAEKLSLRYEQEVILPGYTHPDRVYAIERDQESG